MYARRFLTIFIKDKIFYYMAMTSKDMKKTGLKIGRMSLLLDKNALILYWDDMKLTRGEGFVSLFGAEDEILQKESNQSWKLESIDDTGLSLARVRERMGLKEVWKINAVDEKQIDWVSEIHTSRGDRAFIGKIMLVLSERYKTWVDSWGEGMFYPANDLRDVEVRNPKSEFIGLRGRKKLKGQLPTILLDLSRHNGECSSSIKNASFIPGARLLMAQKKLINGQDSDPSAQHAMFSVRIKIVEEDFGKRKVNKDR